MKASRVANAEIFGVCAISDKPLTLVFASTELERKQQEEKGLQDVVKLEICRMPWKRSLLLGVQQAECRCEAFHRHVPTPTSMPTAGHG